LVGAWQKRKWRQIDHVSTIGRSHRLRSAWYNIC